jgi:MFS family permease
MPGRLSGIDAISPAFERAKSQLFAPFRVGHWVRLAVVCILTGEATGSSGGLGGNSNFNLPSHSTHPRSGFPLGSALQPNVEFWVWLGVGIVALVLLALVLVYVSSVFRFILFDAVLHNQCKLREGWRRWQRQGGSYFLWQIGFGVATLGALVIVVGVPAFVAWRAGLFQNPGKHLASLILGGLGVFLLFVTVLVLSALGTMFAKDFVVPVMALEDQGILDGWRRVLPLLAQDKGACSFYVVMKIILAIGSALLFGIIDFMVVFAMLIPLGVVGVAVYFFAKGAGITWNPVTIGAVAVAGAVVVALFLAVIGFVSTPAMVFFQAYSMHFFGSRYAPLEAALGPQENPPAAQLAAPVPAPIT